MVHQQALGKRLPKVLELCLLLSKQLLTILETATSLASETTFWTPFFLFAASECCQTA